MDATPISAKDTSAAPPGATPPWDAFCAINAARRAVRDFDGRPIPDGDVRAVLEQALLAPSSGNLQAYELHWVRDPGQKELMAAACGGQRAAATASALVVVVAGLRIARRTIASQQAYVAKTTCLSRESKAYHAKQLKTFDTFARIAPLLLWTPLHWLVSLLWPALTLLPVGASGLRHWASRSAIYAAQTLLLAASARGLDSCPMEGFSAVRVAKILGLPRGVVIPVVIALGRRGPAARLEPRWRRTLDTVVVVH